MGLQIMPCRELAIGWKGMMSTEPISASDYPFRKSGWQHFNEKRPPNFKKRLFQTLIDNLICLTCPEMSLFSNDTAKEIRKDVLGAVGECGTEKSAGTPLDAIFRFSVGKVSVALRPGPDGGRKGMSSTEVIFTSVSSLFRSR
jgi:hypothetical protein